MFSIEISYPPTSKKVTMDPNKLNPPEILANLAKKHKAKWHATDQTITIDEDNGRMTILYMSTNYEINSGAEKFMKELMEPYYVDWIQCNGKRVYSNPKNEALKEAELDLTEEEKRLSEIAKSYEDRHKLRN